MNLIERYIKWRLKDMIEAEKRLKRLLSADVQPGTSNQQLDGLLKLMAKELQLLASRQSEIMTLQEIRDEKDK
tara:strand:+ start:106 stop:324 length:219 start_codon:yes stop_codon:yes gene_type:complete